MRYGRAEAGHVCRASTPSGRLEFWSSTLAGWGWPEHAIPGYIRSHVHPSRLAPDQMVLLSTSRLPTQIHTRSANSKWLNELAHTNPLWIRPSDASRLGVARTGDLVRVETEIGYFVAKAWITEGIRPGVVACSHHMGRWKLSGHAQVSAGGAMATLAWLSEHARHWAGLHRRWSRRVPGIASAADPARWWERRAASAVTTLRGLAVAATADRPAGDSSALPAQ